MIGGEKVAISLHNAGFDVVFGLVGNQISPILAYLKKNGIKFIGTRHEQAAVHMADGWAQQNRRCAVAMVSGGPGFTNTINGITKAYKAETPLLIITGSISYSQKDKGNLQDMDQLSIVKECCKWCTTVYDVGRIEEYIYKAIKISMSGKKGPVLLELPIDVLKKNDKNQIKYISNDIENDKSYIHNESLYIKKYINVLKEAKNPLILIGDEVYYNKLENEINDLVSKIKIPVFTINKARGIVADSSAYCFGNGRVIDYGPQIKALKEADIILVLGVPWDYQMDCFGPPTFSKEQYIIYITENDNPFIVIENGIKVIIKMKTFILNMIDEQMNNQINIEKKEWCSYLRKNAEIFWKDLMDPQRISENYVSPVMLLNHISKYIDENTIVVLDGSNAMFWAGLFLKASKVGQLIIAPDGQHGSMGCGLPLALGAKEACPENKVILYTGDGSFGFNLIELDTSLRYNLPITIFVHNDGKWGLCETTQEILYGDVCGTEIQEVDYDKITNAFGGYGYTVNNNDDIEKIIRPDNIFSDRVVCFDIKIDDKAYSPGLLSFNETLKMMK